MIRTILGPGVSALALLIAIPAAAQDVASLPAIETGVWGVATDALDPAVDPGDDFNAYVNGRWVAASEIPSDRTTFGSFAILREVATADVDVLMRELVNGNPAPGTAERRLVDAYQAFFDEAAIEAAGLVPTYPYLTEIYSAQDLARLVELFQSPGYPALVGASVGIDAADPNQHLINVGFGGMGLPDRNYYLVDSPQNLELRAAYRAYLATMLGELGYADPQAAADAIYAFEHQVAELEWDRTILRIPELNYNPVTRDELLALAPSFPFARLLAAGDFAEQDLFDAGQIPPTAEEIAALDLSAEQLAMIGGGLPAMLQLLQDTPLATLKAWMAVQFLRSHAAVLPRRIDAATFAFFGQRLAGQQEQSPRWKRAISSVEGQLGEQLGAVYVARHFPPQAKVEMDALVANLRAAFRLSIQQSSWMTPATQVEALTKLDAFMPMIGYPDVFETYPGLEIRPGDPLGNAIRTMAWEIADARSRLGNRVDRTEWAMLPQTVNAYYSPLFNQIVFPAAFLQPPFFNPQADPAVNYGAIGAVIGHEIGHGFDDSGSRFDATGALRNWWQEEDRAAFTAMADRLKVLIEQFCPADDGQLCLRGDQSIGETIGDVVGLQMAYRAYRLSLNGAEAPVIDGLSGDQRFFLGFAQIWREKHRPESLRNRVMTANHPPGEFRLNNAVRHVDAWYQAFDVGPDDAMYLPPEERVRIF